MAFLLKLKHWQLFLLTWGLSLVANISSFVNFRLFLSIFPLVMLLFVVGVLGWYWAIATTLFKLLPAGVKLNLRRFKVVLALPVVYILFILGYFALSFLMPDRLGGALVLAIMWIIIPLHLLSMAGIFYGLRFAAKVLKSVELQREAHFGDYAAEFFLLWFSIIGVWIVQPRLNQLVREVPQE
ncbi:hypothetical protein [Hymenobacter cellulosilyticus]|uniref:Transmembrane protein n=1 Tax=Hymenobacter cellulosilyticus TaxID=2932248 RepID=A0A8T9QAB0_9BACT|nr:hypothetical protein [Hymenobacter cellulosilyticus]UOQ74516.1 hypothetical protein MUN79_11905 [Hymenobacter cellulosilyticus]